MKQAGWIRCISPFRVYSRKVMEVFEMLDTYVNVEPRPTRTILLLDESIKCQSQSPLPCGFYKIFLLVYNLKSCNDPPLPPSPLLSPTPPLPTSSPPSPPSSPPPPSSLKFKKERERERKRERRRRREKAHLSSSLEQPCAVITFSLPPPINTLGNRRKPHSLSSVSFPFSKSPITS